MTKEIQMGISRRLTFMISLAFAMALPLPASASGGDFSLSLSGVSLRPGVTSDINATVYVNQHFCLGGTVLAIHGFAHTGATWEPFADAMFTDPLTRHGVCRIVAVDLPGHGQSSLPTGIAYGDLTLDDYVTGMLGSLDALKALGIRPRSIIGHSMGGLVMEMMQERLLAQGKDLRSRHGIVSAVALAPNTPAPMPWAFSDSGMAVQAFGPLVVVDEVRGATFSMDASTWRASFFTSTTGQLPAGTPSVEEIDALGWNVPEPLLAGLQVVGVPPFPSRGFVSAGAFAPSRHTVFTLIHLGEDALALESEDLAAYQYLSGDTSGARFITVDDPEAVHDMHVSNPGLLIDSIAAQLFSH
jgi:pimeloyl-ACP methyl ester carboxylesterase